MQNKILFILKWHFEFINYHTHALAHHTHLTPHTNITQFVVQGTFDNVDNLMISQEQEKPLVTNILNKHNHV